MAEYTRGELQDKIQEWANDNVAYRNALMKTPKKVLESHLGKELPEEFEVEVVQDTPAKMYIALGAFPSAQGEELDDDDLENVAGGFGIGNLVGGIGSVVGLIFVLALYTGAFVWPWLALLVGGAFLVPAAIAVGMNVLQRLLLTIRHLS